MNNPEQHIDSYIRNQVSQSVILTRDEETDLVTRWIEQRDHAARDALILAHQKLIAGMATRFSSSGASFADLFNEGVTALISAADRFDPGRKCRFSTYAAWWILSQLQEAVHRDIYTVKIGRSRNEKRILRLLGTARNIIGPSLDDGIIAEIAEFSDTTPEAIKRIDGAMASRSVSLNARVGGQGGEDQGGEIGENFIDETEEHSGAEARLLAVQQRAVLERYFTRLKDRRAAAILRYRWLDDEERSLKEIGTEFNVSAERIRQIERDAMAQIAGMMAEDATLQEHLLS